MDAGKTVPLPTKPGSYAFQPSHQQLAFGVQLRLTPELKEVLLQAQATGERVSLRFRHEPHRDVVLTVGGQEFFFSAAPQAGNVEVLQVPSASTSYESRSVACIKQRLTCMRDQDAARNRVSLVPPRMTVPPLQPQQPIPTQPPAAPGPSQGAANSPSAAAKGAPPGGRPWSASGPSRQDGAQSAAPVAASAPVAPKRPVEPPKPRPPPQQQQPGARPSGQATPPPLAAESGPSPARLLGVPVQPAEVPRAAVLAAKRGARGDLPLCLVAILKEQPLTMSSLQSRMELAYQRAGVKWSDLPREYVKRVIDNCCTMSNNRMTIKADVLARELPKLNELAGSASPTGETSNGSDASHRSGGAPGAGSHRPSGSNMRGAGAPYAPGAGSNKKRAASYSPASDGGDDEGGSQPAAKRPKAGSGPGGMGSGGGAAAPAGPPKRPSCSGVPAALQLEKQKQQQQRLDADYDFSDLSEGGGHARRVVAPPPPATRPNGAAAPGQGARPLSGKAPQRPPPSVDGAAQRPPPSASGAAKRPPPSVGGATGAPQQLQQRGGSVAGTSGAAAGSASTAPARAAAATWEAPVKVGPGAGAVPPHTAAPAPTAPAPAMRHSLSGMAANVAVVNGFSPSNAVANAANNSASLADLTLSPDSLDPSLGPYAELQFEDDAEADLYRPYIDWAPEPHSAIQTPEQYNEYESEYRAKYAVYHRLNQKYNEVLRSAEALREAVDAAADNDERRRCTEALWRHGAKSWQLVEVWKSVRAKLHRDLTDLRSAVTEYVHQQVPDEDALTHLHEPHEQHAHAHEHGQRAALAGH